jgi:hypothetical protein
VAGLWLAVLAAVLTAAGTLSGQTADTFRIPGTPSQQAIDLLQERFPRVSAGGATARVVFAAPDGEQLSTAVNKAAIERAVAELKQAPQVASVSDPFTSGAVNRAGTVGFAQATYRVEAVELTDQARDALTTIVDDARAAGLTVEVGGDALQTQAEQGATEIIGVVVAAVGRAPSTVMREIDKNLHHQRYGNPGSRGRNRRVPWNYSPHGTQIRADRRAASRARPARLANNERLPFPKGTDLSGYHPDCLVFVANELNDRPRKRLAWKTPKEALRELLSEPTDPDGVALAG